METLQVSLCSYLSQVIMQIKEQQISKRTNKKVTQEKYLRGEGFQFLIIIQLYYHRISNVILLLFTKDFVILPTSLSFKVDANL